MRTEVCTEVYFMQMNARVLPLKLILTTIVHTNEHICIYTCFYGILSAAVLVLGSELRLRLSETRIMRIL